MVETIIEPRTIRTISGLHVNVINPDPDTLIITDMAHALSNIPRFGGHLAKFYSVAQHLILAHMLASPDEKYNALMHDVSEAYLLDMPKPIKEQLPDYNIIEDRLMRVLAKKFNFAYPKTPEVQRVDHLLLDWEKRILIYGDTSKFKKIPTMSHKKATAQFLDLYHLHNK